jgi:hypothetical protein
MPNGVPLGAGEVYMLDHLVYSYYALVLRGDLLRASDEFVFYHPDIVAPYSNDSTIETTPVGLDDKSIQLFATVQATAKHSP